MIWLANLFKQFSYNQAIVCNGMQLTYDTTPSINSLSIDIPGICTATASENSGRLFQNGRMIKAKSEYRENTAM